MVIAAFAAYRGSRACTQVPLPRKPSSVPPWRATVRHPAGTGSSAASSAPAVEGAGAEGSGGGGNVLVVVGSTGSGAVLGAADPSPTDVAGAGDGDGLGPPAGGVPVLHAASRTSADAPARPARRPAVTAAGGPKPGLEVLGSPAPGP